MSEEKAAFAGILIAAYPDEGVADKVLETVKDAKEQKTFHYWDAAVIRKDEKGRYFYKETKDMSTPKGAGIGAIIGGIIGIPGGPAGIVMGAGIGTGIGALFANADAGLNDERVEELGHALMSGNSALIVVSDRDYLKSIQQYAAEEETTAVIQQLTADISEHLVHGQKAAYLITAAGRSVSCHQLDAADETARLLGI